MWLRPSQHCNLLQAEAIFSLTPVQSGAGAELGWESVNYGAGRIIIVSDLVGALAVTKIQ